MSAVALAIDTTAFLCAAELGLSTIAAGTTGFSLGLATSYFLSAKFVFPIRLGVSSFTTYALSGLPGLASTDALLVMLSRIQPDAPPVIHKAQTALAVFALTFFLRKHFSRTPSAQSALSTTPTTPPQGANT